MNSVSATVGILILTVFLSLSPPAYAVTTPYTVYDYADYPNGTPADGQLVTIYKAGDPLNNITAEVGSSFGVSGWWKGNLYNIPPVSVVTDGDTIIGDTIVVEVLGEYATYVVEDTNTGGQWISNMVAENDGDSSGGSGGGGGGGGHGTYPPNWNTPAPAPTTTPTPTTTPEPTVTSTSTATPEQTGAQTVTGEAPAETETTPTTKPTQGTPGFGAVSTVFVIAGLLVATYLVMRRRE